MFVLEFESSVPQSAASYYSLVVRRDPYILGRLPNCDVSLPELQDVSRQHLKLEVLRASDALQLDPTYTHQSMPSSPSHAQQLFTPPRDANNTPDDHGGGAGPFGGLEFCLTRIPEALLVGGEEDPLVMRITNLSKYGFQLSPPTSSTAAPTPAATSAASRPGVGGGRSSSDLAATFGGDAAGGASDGGGANGGGLTTRSSSISTARGQPSNIPATVHPLSHPHPVTSSAFVHSGWWVHIGASCVLRISFRPVVVSVARDYSPAYLHELETIYRLLGATCTGDQGPVPLRVKAPTPSHPQLSPSPHQLGRSMPQPQPFATSQAAAADAAGLRKPQPQFPILAAHVCELIADDSWSLMALAAGYTIVEPTYVMEWYGCIATACNVPLHTLPPPKEFSPHTKGATYGTSAYLRPEPATCPFSLYAWPRSNQPTAPGTSTAIVTTGLGTSRDALLQRKLFFSPTDLTMQRNRDAILCGGGVVLDTVEEVLQVSRLSRGGSSSSLVLLAGPPDGRRVGINVMMFSRYVVVEESLEEHIRCTPVAALKEYSKQRKAKSVAASAAVTGLHHQQTPPRRVAGANDDAGSSDDDHDTGSLPNTSLFSHVDGPEQHDGGVDADEATMRLLVKLYLLVQKFNWSIIPERCLHTALLTNVWVLDTIAFHEVVVVETGGAGEEEYMMHRHPSLDQHDNAVFRDIITQKSYRGAVEHQQAAANMMAQLNHRATSNNSGSPRKTPAESPAGRAAASPVHLTSPQPRNPKLPPEHHAVNRGSPRGGGAQDNGDDDDEDRTPSVLSEEDAGGAPHGGAHQGRLEGLMVSPEGRRITSIEFDLQQQMQLTSPDPIKPQATSDIAPGGKMVRQPKNGRGNYNAHGAHGVPPLRAFEAQAEHIHRNIQLLLRPTEMQRLEAVLATTRRLRALEPVDTTFVEGIKSSAEVQLRALEQLNLAHDEGHSGGRHIPATAAVASSSSGGATRSRALIVMWNQCAAVVAKAHEILSFGRRLGHRGTEEGEGSQPDAYPLAPADADVMEAGAGLLGRDDDANNKPAGTVGTHRKHPAQESMSLRPSTRLLRYPTASAPFLGPEIHRVQLNAEQQLTAKLLAPVSATNLAAVAEKRRLFIRRYQAEEGEKRFALWMQSNGMQWTLQLYRQLEERKLTLLEMLQYE